MKSGPIAQASKERVAELATRPEIVRGLDLLAKLKAGTLTTGERDELDTLTADVRALDPNVISELHRPTPALETSPVSAP